VASIDRRDKEKEHESTKRVSSLVEAFQNSALHLTTVQNIRNESSRPVSASSSYGIKKQKGPGYFRVLVTLLR
jgi:hypothetical protein